MADKTKILDGQTVPFRGGMDTRREKSLIPFGGFSEIQNMRMLHPGMQQRLGIGRHHTTADGSNNVMSLHQFSKGSRSEKHFFAQMSDGDVLEATDAPPTTTTGAFGSEVHDGTSSGMHPASWSDLEDIMIYSNGSDQHQLYAGTANKVLAFIKFDGSAAPGSAPTDKIDYTREVTDGDSSTVAVLDSLDTLANFECVFIATDVPANRLTWTVSKPNGTASVGTLSYWNGSAWTDTTETDGTIDTGATLGQTGSMTWTPSATEVPTYLFGISAYWYQWQVATQLDEEVEISEVTYGSGFADLTNVWNGTLEYATEVIHYDDSASTYYTYAGSSVDIGGFELTNDALYFGYAYPIEGIYVDVGTTPNTAATTIASFSGWDGDSWASITVLNDYTGGFDSSGYIRIHRQSQGTVQKSTLSGKGSELYWYKIVTAGANVAASITISIEVMPYFFINDFGSVGNTSTTWQDRGVYTFGRYPSYLYVSEKNRPNVLNGDDYTILRAGDGRLNEIRCMKRLKTQLLIWQEEKGKEGGCLTSFSGSTVATFSKTLLSDRLGTFSAKSVVVVDGVSVASETDENRVTVEVGSKYVSYAYFLSRYGVCRTDGSTVSIVSGDVANHFDPTHRDSGQSAGADSIRRGYEEQMWIGHDSTMNVLIVGLVTGSSATTCNTFLVYDLEDGTWSYDAYGQNLSCMTEVEADSGNISVLQYGGGTNDGAVYQMNTGDYDLDIDNTAIAINAFVTMELSYKGMELDLRGLILRLRAIDGYTLTLTPYRNEVAKTALTLSMSPEATNEIVRRHNVGIGLKGHQLSLKFQQNTSNVSFYLIDFGLVLNALKGR